MPPVRLTFPLKPINSALLNEQLTALAISGYAGWVITVAQQIGVDVADSTSSADQTRIANVIAAHDSTQLSSTGINANGLTAAQQANLDAETAWHSQIATFDGDLAAFIGLANPTNAQAVAMVKEMAQAWRFVIRRIRDGAL